MSFILHRRVRAWLYDVNMWRDESKTIISLNYSSPSCILLFDASLCQKHVKHHDKLLAYFLLFHPMLLVPVEWGEETAKSRASISLACQHSHHHLQSNAWDCYLSGKISTDCMSVITAYLCSSFPLWMATLLLHNVTLVHVYSFSGIKMKISGRNKREGQRQRRSVAYRKWGTV